MKSAIWAVFIAFGLLSACSGKATRPCTRGWQEGQEPPEIKKTFKGDKLCEQSRDKDGKWTNDGKYMEYYPSGFRAIQGEYKDGARVGTWTYWDESGKKIWDKFYVNGAEVPSRSAEK